MWRTGGDEMPQGVESPRFVFRGLYRSVDDGAAAFKVRVALPGGQTPRRSQGGSMIESSITLVGDRKRKEGGKDRFAVSENMGRSFQN